MKPYGRVALGALAGAALAGLLAPHLRAFFHVPDVGVGILTVVKYPKGWDYAVAALLVVLPMMGGVLAGWRRGADVVDAPDEVRVSRRSIWVASVAMFVLMLFVHDSPYDPMEPFHEGEHLVPGWLMQTGARPYGDVFVFHGLFADAALDAAVLGHPPSPRRVRREQTVLNALTLALLVPVAAEVTATTAGMVCAALLGYCGTAALLLPLFPWYRLLPIVLATLGMLRYARTGRARALLLAWLAASVGVLWSLDVGMYTVAGVAITYAGLRLFRLEAKPLPAVKLLTILAIAIAAPVVILLATRADMRQFAIDSFVIMPKAIDAIWSLPAPTDFHRFETYRYYAPPVFYGFLLALAVVAYRRGDRVAATRLGIVATMAALLFRSAAGRVSWGHTRFAMPLLGVAVVAFLLEPLLRRRRAYAAIGVALMIPLFFYFDVRENAAAGAKLLGGWRARQRHEGLVPYPFATGKGIYATPDNARDLAALNGFIESLGPHDAPILDISNERALYYILARRPPVRCPDISMLSVPRLLDEAMTQLDANPPVCVILEGYPTILAFDGLTNRNRVPRLAEWIDRNYPKHTQIGRFVVATR